jgi:superfamily II DNA or RNA helicase
MAATLRTAVSARGYSIVKSDLGERGLSDLKAELTVAPFLVDAAMKPRPFKVFMESTTKIYVPKAYGLSKFGVPGVNRLPEGEDIEIKFAGSLRKEQEAPVNTFLQVARDPARGGGVISLPCAAGKTVLSIYILCALKKKTLIVVHKDFLLQQWRERIQQFAPEARIGLLKAQKVDVEDKDIVMASLQSLSMKDYQDDLFHSFGFAIYDECHHLSAEVFSQALKKVNTRHCLGLSATPKRKDGLTKVFLWHLGDIIYSITKRTDVVDVQMIEYFDDDPAYSEEQYMYRGKLNMAKMINNICDHRPRIEFVVNTIWDILQAERGRRFLVLSDRRAHVDAMVDRLRELGVDSAQYYGGMKAEQLKAAEDKTVIVSTFAQSNEGLDLPGLNTLVLTTPKSDIIQASGRILRDKPEQRLYTPLIIDIVDKFSLFVNQAKKRAAYYKKCKYNVKSDTAEPKEKQDQTICFIDV